MSDAVDPLELLAQDAYPPEFEREFNCRLTALYAELKVRHSWMRNLFRTVTRHEPDIDGMVNETLRRYLKDVGATLWVTKGLASALPEPVVEDGELIGLVLPSTGRPAEPIRDIGKYTFAHPDAWFRSVARGVLRDHARKLAAENNRVLVIQRAAKFPTRRNGKPQCIRPSWFVDYLYHPPRNVEQWLVLQCRNREIREPYMAALKKLGPVQRAAWILCKDELLKPKEAECLLAPVLHWRTARTALSNKPMKDAEASRLLDREDVSPDVTKARSKLAEQLADLNPGRAWGTPAQKRAREFLIGFSRSGSTLAVRPWTRSTREDSVISDKDKDFLLQMPPRYLSRQASRPDQERECDLFWRGQETKKQPSWNLVPGWYTAPEPDDPQYVSLVQRIRELRKVGKRWTTIAKALNAAGFPSRFGSTWHHSGVKLTAARARLVK